MPDNSFVLDPSLFNHELPEKTEIEAGYIDDEPIEAAPDSSDDIIDESIKEAQENQPHTTELDRILIQAENERGRLSFKGEPYDPVLHQYPPSETKGGKWRNKSKAQKRQWGLLDPPGENHQEPIQSNNAIRSDAENMALMYATMHVTLFGPDGMAKNRDQIVPLVDSWEKVFNEYGTIELPPWAELALSHANYSRGIIAQSQKNIDKAKAIGRYLYTKGWLSIKKSFNFVFRFFRKGAR